MVQLALYPTMAPPLHLAAICKFEASVLMYVLTTRYNVYMLVDLS